MYEEKTKKEYDWKGIALKVALAVVVLILIFKLLPLNNTKGNGEVSATFKANMTSLKDAGYSYFTNEKLPKNVGEKNKVSLGDLISEGQVQDLKTEDGEACDIEASYAQVTKTVNNYELEINLICGSEEDSESYYLGGNGTTTTTTVPTTEPSDDDDDSNTGNNSNNNSSNTNSSNTGYNKPSNNKSSNNTQTTKQATASQVIYTVVFNTDGGTGVNYQRVNTGNKASVPANPTKTGYYFAGWYYNGSEFNFSTPITKNVILKAKWVLNGSNTNKPTVTSKTTSKTTAKASTNSNSLTIYNKDQNGNYVNSSTLTLYVGNCQSKSCSSNSVYASWTTTSNRNPNTMYQLPIGYYTLESTKTPAGYETPSKLLIYISNTNSNKSETFTTYKKAEAAKTVKITYNSNGGTTYSPLTINSGGYATNYTPYRANATFLGWYLNGQKFNFNTKIYENITLVAKYKVTETYNTTVYSIGWGTQKSTFTVSHTLAIPSALKSSQYQNVRIKNGGLKFNRTLSTATDLYDYAKYRNDTFEGYVVNGWEYTSGSAANFATISSASFAKTSSDTYSRGVKWTGNVSKQCTTPFNFSGISNACLYGISYNVTWEYEIER